MALCPLDVLGKRSNLKCSRQNMGCFSLSKGVFPESWQQISNCVSSGYLGIKAVISEYE